MASKILEQYRAQNPDASSQNDSQLARKIYEESYSDLDINTFGERVGIEPIKIAEDLHRQYYSDLEFNEFADRIGLEAPADNSGRPELMTPLVNEPNNPEGRRFPNKGRPERVDVPSSSDTETQQDVGRIDSLSQAGAQTQNQTPLSNEGPGFRIEEPDLGLTGRDFSLIREQGIAGTGTFEAADGSSLIGAPMGVDQNIDEAAQTAYQMQGRGERSADDLRRGVERLKSANKAIQLVSSVSNILNANERMERRDDQFIDNRNRLAGGNANVDPEFSQFVDRRGYPTRSEALVAQEREDRETLEREQQRAQELAGELAEIQARRDELGENVTLRRALESGDVDTFLGQLSENPLDVMSGLVLESLPAMTPALGAGVVGGLAAGPGGAAVGVGGVSAITEGVLTIQEKLREYGADLSDPESVKQVWSENSDEILADAATRGTIIGAFDAASGGIASKPILAAREGASTASRLARGTADFTARTATQGGLGSAGEASAQLATEGEISSPAEVIAEGVAEFGFAPVEVASLSAASARRRLSGSGDASDLRTQMLKEGYTEVGDGTLRRGDVIVEIDGDEARARLAQRDDPRQPTAPAPEPTEEAPAPAPVQPPQETPDQALDAVIDNAAPPSDLPDVQTSLEALNRRIQQREQELRSAGVPDDQIQSEQTIVSLRQQAQSLANVDRQTRSQQAEQNANNAIDSQRAPTDDALGLQVQSIRQEAQTRSPLRDEIQRLRERASVPATDPQIAPVPAPDLSPAPEQPSQSPVSAQSAVLPTVRANGQPFSTQTSVRRSTPFRNATNPEIVPIGEGFGVIDRGESDASLDSFPRLESAESDRPASAPPINNPATGEFTPERVPTQNIEIDPETYQFRDDVNRDGVDDRLEGITRFDDLRAGTIILHERNDGRTFVADGHHRIDLARRLGRDSINAIVLRESDGFSTADARRFAAERNVSEGNATPIDAAKVFREYGGDPSTVAEDRDLPRRSQVVRDGAAIAQLSDDAFGAVLNEQITEKDAASIGRNFTDADQQLAAIEQFQRVRPANDRQREILADEIRRAGFSQGEQGGLFGDDPAESLITERVQVKDATQRRLSRRSSLFRTLNENAGAAERAGNQIARDQNSAIQQNAAIAADLVRRADTTPELNQAINQAAQRVKDGEPIGRVAGELEERIVNEAQRLGSTPQGLASDSSLGPANQAGQDAGGGESIPPADTGRDGEG